MIKKSITKKTINIEAIVVKNKVNELFLSSLIDDELLLLILKNLANSNSVIALGTTESKEIKINIKKLR